MKRGWLLGILLLATAGWSRSIDLSPLADLDAADSLQQVRGWERSEPSADTTMASPSEPLDPLERPKYVVRNFDHKEQVITGSIIMSCLALMMVTMNNYNPR